MKGEEKKEAKKQAKKQAYADSCELNEAEVKLLRKRKFTWDLIMTKLKEMKIKKVSPLSKS